MGLGAQSREENQIGCVRDIEPAVESVGDAKSRKSQHLIGTTSYPPHQLDREVAQREQQAFAAVQRGHGQQTGERVPEPHRGVSGGDFGDAVHRRQHEGCAVHVRVETPDGVTVPRTKSTWNRN